MQISKFTSCFRTPCIYMTYLQVVSFSHDPSLAHSSLSWYSVEGLAGSSFAQLPIFCQSMKKMPTKKTNILVNTGWSKISYFRVRMLNHSYRLKCCTRWWMDTSGVPGHWRWNPDPPRRSSCLGRGRFWRRSAGEARQAYGMRSAARPWARAPCLTSWTRDPLE